MSGFLGIGNNKQETEDRRATTGAWNNLGNIFNYGMSQGSALASAGGNFLTKLLSGSRSALESTLAPERAAVQTSADAARRNLAASGTARGGGTAATNQTIGDTETAQINNALLGERAGAAGPALSAGSNLLGLGEQAESTIGSQSVADYQTQAKKAADASQAILSGVALGLGA